VLGRAGQDHRVTYLSDSPADADLLARVRADVRPLRAHFNHAGASLTPAPVLARMAAHLELEAEVGGYEAESLVAAELAGLPGRLAPLLGVDAD
jgi:hypothetical protein